MARVELAYYVVGWEYRQGADADAAFDRACAMLKDCSLWRVATPDLSRWFLIGLSVDPIPDGYDPGPAKPYKPSRAQMAWMLDRRLQRGVRAVRDGEDEVRERNTFPEGILIPGGNQENE